VQLKRQTRAQQRFAISEVAADWHELMIIPTAYPIYQQCIYDYRHQCTIYQKHRIKHFVDVARDREQIAIAYVRVNV